MFIKSTIVKVLIIVLVLGIAFFLFQQRFGSVQNQQSTTTPAASPTSKISLAPQDKQSGWTTDEENQILKMCPLPSFMSGICTCALTKVEEKYSFNQAMAMYNEYQKDKTIDPKLSDIINQCK